MTRRLLLPITLAILVYLYFRARGETRKPVTWPGEGWREYEPVEGA